MGKGSRPLNQHSTENSFWNWTKESFYLWLVHIRCSLHFHPKYALVPTALLTKVVNKISDDSMNKLIYSLLDYAFRTF